MTPKRLLTAAVLTLAMLASPVARADDAAAARQLDIFNALFKELNTFYVDTIDVTKSMETGINAMLDDIDPYTEYIPAKEQDDFMVLSTGAYGGIGSYILERQKPRKGVYISGPYAGSPAERAGLRHGDRIVRINDEDVSDWPSSRVSAALKGQPGTSLTVQVVRPWTDDSVLTFDIKRETINISPVPYYGVVRGHIGYISLTTFNEHSADMVRDAVVALKSDRRVDAIALDLRGNGGGIMEGAVQIVGCFVPKGTQVVVTRGRDKASEKVYKTTREPVDTRIPLVVFIDGGAASASEITAGALQDLDRAVIIGSRSYGKGLVQTTRPLPYDGILKVTVAKYYIPSGRLIQEIDYSRRNADGTFEHKPDSLCNVFTTRHGREVRDGGGITPDIKVDYPELNRLTYNIARDQWAFDFATRYAATHPTLPAPDRFEVTDSLYEAFKQSIDPQRFEYDKVCEQGLKQLRKLAKSEGYANDSTDMAFDQLERLLKHDLDHDLDVHRDEIAPLLANEIIDRYYHQAGQVEFAARDDRAIKRADELLTTPGEWYRTLGLKVPRDTRAKR